MLHSVESIEKNLFDSGEEHDLAAKARNKELATAISHDPYYGLNNTRNIKKWGDAFNYG